MAFDLKGWKVFSTGHVINAPRYWSYNSSDDAIATIIASGYFDEQINFLKKNDLFWIIGSDTSGLYAISSDDGVTPVTVVEIAPAP